jgi:hypothetical protein
VGFALYHTVLLCKPVAGVIMLVMMVPMFIVGHSVMKSE